MSGVVKGDDWTSVVNWTPEDLAGFIGRCWAGSPTAEDRDSVLVTEFPRSVLDLFDKEFLPDIPMPNEEQGRIDKAVDLFWYRSGQNEAVGVAHKGYLWAYRHADDYFKMEYPLVFLTGTPGTGKSLSVQLLLQTFVQAARDGRDRAGGVSLPKALALWCRSGTYLIQRVTSAARESNAAEHRLLLAWWYQDVNQQPSRVWPPENADDGSTRDLLPQVALRQAVSEMGDDAWQITEKLEATWNSFQKFETRRPNEFKVFGHKTIVIASDDWLTAVIKEPKYFVAVDYPVIGLPTWTKEEFMATATKAMDLSRLLQETELHDAAKLITDEEWRVVRGNDDGGDGDSDSGDDDDDVWRPFERGPIRVTYSVRIQLPHGRLVLTPGQQSLDLFGKRNFRGIQSVSEGLKHLEGSSVDIADRGDFVEVQCGSYAVRVGKAGDWWVQVYDATGKLLDLPVERMARRLRLELLVWLLLRGTNPRLCFTGITPVPSGIHSNGYELALPDAVTEDSAMGRVKAEKRQRILEEVAEKWKAASHSVFLEVTGCFLHQPGKDEFVQTKLDLDGKKYVTDYPPRSGYDRAKFYTNCSTERLIEPLNKLAFRQGLAQTLQRVLQSSTNIKGDLEKMVELATAVGAYGQFFEGICHRYVQAGGATVLSSPATIPRADWSSVIQQLTTATAEFDQEELVTQQGWRAILKKASAAANKWIYVRPQKRNYPNVDAFLINVGKRTVEVGLLQITTTGTHAAIEDPKAGSVLVVETMKPRSKRRKRDIELKLSKIFVVPEKLRELRGLEKGADCIVKLPSLMPMDDRVAEVLSGRRPANRRASVLAVGSELPRIGEDAVAQPTGRKRSKKQVAPQIQTQKRHRDQRNGSSSGSAGTK